MTLLYILAIQYLRFYDSLIAKLICHEEDRNKAIERMRTSLLSFRISGIPSTIPFHLSALVDQRFLRGDYDTTFVNGLKPFASREGAIAAKLFLCLAEEDPNFGKRRIKIHV